MEKKNIYFLIFILVALLFTAIIVNFSKKIEDFSILEVKVPDQLKPLLLYLNQKTIACLDKVPIGKDPKIGIDKFQRLDSYADYFYRAHLKSAEQVKINDCEFVKLGMVYEPKFYNAPFELYLPQNMPSPGTDKTILPQELSQYLDKRLQIKVRYWVDSSSSNPDSIKGILGWQLEIIFEN